MNRILSFVFVACLAMLSFGAFAQTTYVKVTNASQLVDGGKYLIVYEDGNVAFDGSLTSLDAVGNTKPVTISDGTISVTDNDFYFTLGVIDGGYSVKSASNYYIGNTSDANTLKASQTEVYVNTLEVTASSIEIISANTHLRFNSASDQNRFRYFKSTSYTNQKAISLFVDASSLSDDPMISIITPVNGSTIYYTSSVTATVQVLNFTAGTDGNISFSVDEEAAVSGMETSHTFTNLADGQHTIHASLVGTDENVIVTATSTFTIDLNGPTTTPIHDIQYTEAEDGDSPLNEQTVTVRGTVTAFNSDKFYIQDEEAAWSGLYIYNTTSSWTPALNDNVIVTGEVSEHNGLTEITPTEILNNGASTPINGLALANISEIGEAYESVLVTVTGTCTNIASANKWTISDGTQITIFGLAYTPTEGTSYTVTGIVDWYSNDGIWELKPRSAADIIVGGGTPVISITNPLNGSIIYSASVNVTVSVFNFIIGTDGNVSFSIDEETAVVGTETSHAFTGLTDGQHTITASLIGTDESVIATATSTFTVNLAGPTYTTIHDIQYTEDESGDSPLNNQTVWVKGIVTSNFINTPYFPVKGYSIQDANEAWSGIWVFDSNNNPNIGDSVRFQALVTEYYGLTELKNVANFEIYAQGAVSPIEVTVNEANSEAYEGCYVRVECVRSVGHTMPYGNWACVNETGDTVTFSHNFENNTYTIEDNARYMVSGVVEYSYGKYYVNYPTVDDITAGCDMGPSIIITNPANGSEVYASSVNATVEVLGFTPGTDGNISFSIDEAATVSGTATSHTFEGLEDGLHTIHASLVGNDQNVIVTATSTFTVNLAGPTYTAIRDIQYTENESGDSPLNNQTVWVKGIVTSNFINTPYFPVKGYSIQDANEAWSGIWVFDSINNPNIGDSVKFQAKVTEYYGLTELKNVANFENYGEGTVSPIDVTVNEAKSEAYEGCYVRVECARSVGSTMPYGNWACVNETGDTVTYSHNFENGSYTIEQNVNYIVSGVVEYSYGKYYVNYPTVDDITVGCGMGPSIIITNPANGSTVYSSAVNATVEVFNFEVGTDGNISFSLDGEEPFIGTATSHPYTGLTEGQHTITASLVGNDQSIIVTATSTFTVNLAGPDFTAIRDIQYTTEESGDSPLNNQTVWVKGVVTSNFINTPYRPVKGYSIQDANEAWSGVWVFDSINNPNIGDSVMFQALVTEYYGLTELKNVTNFDNYAMGEVTPIDVTVDEANSEAYEGCYVRVECVRSVGSTMPYGNWECENESGDTVTFSHNFENGAYSIEQDKYYGVSGIVEYSYGKYYVNYPSVDDIVVDCNLAVDEISENSIEVYPNPTNGQINITNAEGKSIVVINTLGQVVAHIDNASENQTIDMSGLCTGTYFVKVGVEVVKLNVIK